MVRISDAIDICGEILKESVSDYRQEAQKLIGYVIKKDKLYIVTHKDEVISQDDLNELKKISEKRAKGKPFAYITGVKEFMSLEFEVNENVLIPRPETEELVDIIIEMFKDAKPNILDLCTGSGAICVSLAQYLENANCTGVDISQKALETAKRNAKKLKVDNRCTFKHMDVLNPQDLGGCYDVVVSNPPYIETSVIETLDETVKNFEPILALDGGCDGLIFYRKIVDNICAYLKNGGMLFFEIGYNQGEAVKKIMSEKLADVKIIKDISGNDRIAIGKYEC